MAEPSKYETLIAAARDGTPAVTVVAHPCDESSLRGALDAAAAGLIEPVLVGPEAKIRRVAARARAGPRGAGDRRRAAQPRRGRPGGGADPRRQGRAPDEGEPAHRRADEGGDRRGDRAAHRAADQPRLHHGRARPPGDAVHHRRGDQHLPEPRRQARHRPERHRPLGGDRHGDAARGDPVGGGDGHHQDPVDDRRRRALQDGRPRPDHRRVPRGAAGLRQRRRSRGGADQGPRRAGGRAGRRSWWCRTWRPATCWRRT